jgi:hypothetical protein
MPKFVIEREMPGVGALSPEELQGASQTSCGVLKEMGPQIQWLHSYVTGDKLFPVNRVSRVVGIIDPTTAEAEGTG